MGLEPEQLGEMLSAPAISVTVLREDGTQKHLGCVSVNGGFLVFLIQIQRYGLGLAGEILIINLGRADLRKP